MRVLIATMMIGVASAFSSAPFTVSNTRDTTSALHATFLSRQDFLAASLLGTTATLVGPPTAASAAETTTLPNGVTYTVTKKGDGPAPSIGELVAIRFKASFGENNNVIDDIFETPEPYYTRCGSGGMIKGVEAAIPYMRVGDRWVLNIPGELAFGKKGRPASAGKPRIPSDATITFDIEMVGLPGKEPELIELIGDV